MGRAIINIQSVSATLDSLNFNMKKMAYQSYIKDGLLSVLQIWLPFFVMLSFIITALQTTKGVTYEKEKRLKVNENGGKAQYLDKLIFFLSFIFLQDT